MNETGKYEDFKLKLQERLCSCVQLETCDVNKDVLEKYLKALKAEKNARNAQILDALEPCQGTARCGFGYQCLEKCHFKDGIKLTRKI